MRVLRCSPLCPERDKKDSNGTIFNQFTYNGRAVENVQASVVPLARPTDKVLLYFRLIIFAKNPKINEKAINRMIA